MHSSRRKSSLVECNPGAEAASRARRLSLASALLWSSEEIDFSPVDTPERITLIPSQNILVVKVVKPILTLLLGQLLVLIEAFLHLSQTSPFLNYPVSLIIAFAVLFVLILPILIWNIGFRNSILLLLQRGWYYLLAAGTSSLVRQWPQPKWNPVTTVIFVVPFGMGLLQTKYSSCNICGWITAIFAAVCVHWSEINFQPTVYCLGGILIAARATWDQIAIQQNPTEWLVFTGLGGAFTELIRLIINNIRVFSLISFNPILLFTFSTLHFVILLGQAFILNQGGADFFVLNRLSLSLFYFLLKGEWTLDPWLWTGSCILILSFALFISHINKVHLSSKREIIEIITTDG